jgi:hypothetical protein
VTAYIPISDTEFAVLDLEDVPKVLDFNLSWSSNGNGYARARNKYMHKILCDAEIVDHRNRDRLDNRKCNLIASTYALNNTNRIQTPEGQHRGVTQRTVKCFQARIKVRCRKLYLGSIPTADAAAKAYDKAAISHHGDAAILNFPKETV